MNDTIDNIIQMMNKHHFEYVDDNGFNESYLSELNSSDVKIKACQSVWQLALEVFSDMDISDDVQYLDYISFDEGSYKLNLRTLEDDIDVIILKKVVDVNK